ncbi:hypothetical protein PRIPAC_79151 [Pristionchus pacificus]|nr:hypothetical protein PRIPAC_79151 [Pristionchus pacificus]
MQQLRNNVHCIALLGDRKAGLYFGALDAREMNVLASVIHDNRRELLFSLSCDNATRRDCALFESAYIHHSCAEGLPYLPLSGKSRLVEAAISRLHHRQGFAGCGYTIVAPHRAHSCFPCASARLPSGIHRTKPEFSHHFNLPRQ